MMQRPVTVIQQANNFLTSDISLVVVPLTYSTLNGTPSQQTQVLLKLQPITNNVWAGNLILLSWKSHTLISISASWCGGSAVTTHIIPQSIRLNSKLSNREVLPVFLIRPHRNTECPNPPSNTPIHQFRNISYKATSSNPQHTTQTEEIKQARV